jgi:hypothetical protein
MRRCDKDVVLESETETVDLLQSAKTDTKILAHRAFRIKTRNAWRWFSLTMANILEVGSSDSLLQVLKQNLPNAQFRLVQRYGQTGRKNLHQWSSFF